MPIMKPIIFVTMIMLYSTAFSQKTNLASLPEKERNEYLIKTAYETVMRYGPDWYRDYKSPKITSNVISKGPDKGRLQYAVTWFHDPSKETMEWGYSVGVGIYANTGAVRMIGFGDGTGYLLSKELRNRSTLDLKPHPYKRRPDTVNSDGSVNLGGS